MRLTDPKFKYTNSASTNVVGTLKKFGFKPTTEAERKARQIRIYGDPKGRAEAEDNIVTALDPAKRKVRATGSNR